MDDGREKKKSKETKKCVIKRYVMFESYKDSLFNQKNIFKKQQRFKSYYYEVYAEDIDKVVLSSNDNKRI